MLIEFHRNFQPRQDFLDLRAVAQISRCAALVKMGVVRREHISVDALNPVVRLAENYFVAGVLTFLPRRNPRRCVRS